MAAAWLLYTMFDHAKSYYNITFACNILVVQVKANLKRNK